MSQRRYHMSGVLLQKTEGLGVLAARYVLGREGVSF